MLSLALSLSYSLGFTLRCVLVCLPAFPLRSLPLSTLCLSLSSHLSRRQYTKRANNHAELLKSLKEVCLLLMRAFKT